jgi:two-component system, chemotaxis family, chemotaxis protein CheY
MRHNLHISWRFCNYRHLTPDTKRGIFELGVSRSINKLNSMKALILEDDYVCRLVLQRMLLDHGLVDVSVNGKEALALFLAAHKGNAPYDVIFLDVMVPEMSGHTVLREMRAFEQKQGIVKDNAARILMITALGDKDSVVQAIRSGCDSYIVKPLRLQEIRQHLKKFGKIH